jgi:hypothetical protein
VEFWKMLNRASTVILGMSVLAAAVGVFADKSSGAEFNGTAAGAWIVVGLVSAASLGALTLFGERLLDDRMLAQRYHAALVVANIVWISGLVYATGGVERPYWALAASPLLIAAVSMTRTRSLLVGCFSFIAISAAILLGGPLH